MPYTLGPDDVRKLPERDPTPFITALRKKLHALYALDPLHQALKLAGIQATHERERIAESLRTDRPPHFRLMTPGNRIGKSHR